VWKRISAGSTCEITDVRSVDADVTPFHGRFDGHIDRELRASTAVHDVDVSRFQVQSRTQRRISASPVEQPWRRH